MRICSDSSSSAQVEHIDGVTGEESDVAGGFEGVGDVLRRLNLSNGDETWAIITDGISNELSSFCFTFSSQNSGLCLLFTLEYDEFSALSSLLRNLFCFNSACEISRELQISDRNIIENYIEFQSAFAKNFANLIGDFLSLRDKLFSVVLGDN